jgi:hypothetical protein
VDAICSGLFCLGHLLAQTSEVSGENRRRKLHVLDPAHVIDASQMP